VFGDYREIGVLYHRGFTIQEIVDGCFVDTKDPDHGRQTPMCFGYYNDSLSTI